nr:MAG TPA: hypothetical protein [Caudoviricetes sp.]
MNRADYKVLRCRNLSSRARDNAVFCPSGTRGKFFCRPLDKFLFVRRIPLLTTTRSQRDAAK